MAGIDVNMPCLGFALVAKDLEAARDVLRVCERLGIELSEPFYTRKGLCVTAVVELPWYENPVHFLRRRVEGYLRYMLPDVRRVRRVWGRLVWKRVRLPAAEADVLMPLVERLLREYGMPGLKLPATVAEDLEELVYEWGRRWRRSYDWAFKVATGRIFRAVSRLSRRHVVLVKLEDLRGIKRKEKWVPVIRRWPWTRLLRLTLGCTPPWVGVALVNPRGTSSDCPACGGELKEHSYRELVCESCGRKWHRDAAGAANVAFAKPVEYLRFPASSPMNPKKPGGGEDGGNEETQRTSRLVDKDPQPRAPRDGSRPVAGVEHTRQRGPIEGLTLTRPQTLPPGFPASKG